MNELKDRLTHLNPAQRLLLEKRLRERGLGADPARDARATAVSPGAGEEDASAWRGRIPLRPLQFSLYFFSDDGSSRSRGKYRLALDSARFADENGFDAVWTPERHFQPFGGLYPNPSVLGAALAAVTRRVGIRAGSVALPLHNPLRVAEEWSVVDNLSDGRAGVSFASGWHPDDFVLFPTPYDDRKEAMFRGIETIRALWSGDAVAVTGPDGREIRVTTLPRPVQPELPIWVTTAGNPSTWERAGAIGANVLGALVGYTPEDLRALIERYRKARAAAGHDPATGRVTLVAHTYVGESDAGVRELVREPMTAYLKTYLAQFRKTVPESAPSAERDARDVAALAFEHYYASSTLLGTQNKCAQVLDVISACGADEVACLIDFGVEPDRVLAALPRLAEIREHYAGGAADPHEALAGDALAEEKHG
jgi:natural product biosynthesis luciferase-like monooxygenase protein